MTSRIDSGRAILTFRGNVTPDRTNNNGSVTDRGGRPEMCLTDR